MINSWCPHSQLLTKSFRQAGDEHLLQALSRIRNGDTDVLRQLIEDSGRPLPDIDGIVPTKLYSRNANVDKANDEELSRLPGNSVGFKVPGTCRSLATSMWCCPFSVRYAVTNPDGFQGTSAGRTRDAPGCRCRRPMTRSSLSRTRRTGRRLIENTPSGRSSGPSPSSGRAGIRL